MAIMKNTAPTGDVGYIINGAQAAIVEILVEKGGSDGGGWIYNR
jgi:hypothetical protein